MANEILPYIEMCQREGVSLQRGMNYELGGNHSVILMSVRPGAPYADRFEDDGSTIIYEGHDVPRSPVHPNPKAVDQPEFTPTGQPTENGKFHSAAQLFKSGHRLPERIRVYEKIKQGIWSSWARGRAVGGPLALAGRTKTTTRNSETFMRKAPPFAA